MVQSPPGLLHRRPGLCPYQHERLDLHHPRGGQGKYLEKPLFDHYRDYLDDYAKTVLKDGGQPAMKRSMEHLSDEVEVTAPREWGDLRKSGHPQVKLGDRTVYDRAPKAARLTDAGTEGQVARHPPRAPRCRLDRLLHARRQGHPHPREERAARAEGAAVTTPAVITVARSQVVIDFLTAAGWDATQEYGYPLYPGPEILAEPGQGGVHHRDRRAGLHHRGGRDGRLVVPGAGPRPG